MTAVRLKSRHWIVDDQDRIIMGEGRRAIFENIDKTGSINRTAKLMKMSYKGVWSKIKASEDYLQQRLVETDRSKGASLTAEGRELLDRYISFKRWCDREEKVVFEGIFHKPSSTETDR